MTEPPDAPRPPSSGHAPFEGEESGEESSVGARLSRFEALIGALPDLVFRMSRDHVFLDYIQPQGRELYRPPELFLGRRLGEVLPSNVVEIAAPAIDRVIASGAVERFEYTLDFSDGRHVFETRVVRAGDREVIAIVRDVSERARADEAERRYAERLRVLDAISRAALSSLELPVLCTTLGEVLLRELPLAGASINVFTGSGRMRIAAVHVSGEGDRLRSRPIFPVPGYIQAAVDSDAPLREYTIPADSPDETSRRLRQEGVTHAVTVPLRVEGVALAVLNLGFRQDPALDDDQRALLRAVGDRIASAVSNALLHERVQRHEIELRQAQRLESLGRLAGGIAHDFNNLLTLIEMHVGMARRRLGRGEPPEADLREIERSVHRAADMTRQLLAFGRRGPLDVDVLCIDVVAREVEPIVRRLLGETVRVELRCGAGEAHVEADRASLEQVFLNLALNARDAMPGGGSLRIETERLEDGEAVGVARGPVVHVAVADTGSGMDEATLERIFDPFFTTKAEQGGSGLGLASVHGVVSQSGGRVTVQSVPGEGATFHLYLPEVEASRASRETRRPPSSDSGARGTLLLVEDDPAVRDVTARLLRDHGFSVLEAEDGVAALELLAEKGDSVAAVVTDVVMPRMGGVELVTRLTEERPGLPILLVSGYDEGRLEGLPAEAAVVDTLLKPVPPRHLLSVLDAALSERPSSP